MATDIQAVTSDMPVEAATLQQVTHAIPWRRLLAGGTLTVVGAAASNLLSFLFSFSMARVLRPEEFATLTACMSLLVVAAIPGATLQLVSARYTALWEHRDPARAHSLATQTSRIALALGLGFGAIVLAFAHALAAYLRLQSTMPLLVVAAILLTSFVGPALRGRLQGLHRFGQFATASSIEFAVRAAAGIVLVIAGLREAGALGAILMGSIASAGIAWWFARDANVTGRLATVPWGRVLRWALPAVLVQCSLSVLLYLDTLLAKHYFSPTLAGQYAGLATCARVLVYASGALASFLFPVAARGQHGRHGRLVSHLTIGMVLCMELALLGICYADPELVMHAVVGSQYDAVSRYLAPLALALGAYGLLSMIITYLLATAARHFWIPLLAAPLAEGLLMALFHNTLVDYIHAIDAVMLVALAFLACAYFVPPRGMHESTRE